MSLSGTSGTTSFSSFIAARINELAKDGLLIREETGTYRISRFGEDRVRSILTSSTPG
jgi:Mn-dependent DtxR family transcriptional regulator